MAKKHLLYIHDERFQAEPHKSQLVNCLLEAHYGESQAQGTQTNPKRLPAVQALETEGDPDDETFFMGRRRATFDRR